MRSKADLHLAALGRELDRVGQEIPHGLLSAENRPYYIGARSRRHASQSIRVSGPESCLSTQRERPPGDLWVTS